MNIFESILNILYLSFSCRRDPAAIVIGFLSVALTTSKTLLYVFIEGAYTLIVLSSALSVKAQRTAASLASSITRPRRSSSTTSCQTARPSLFSPHKVYRE